MRDKLEPRGWLCGSRRHMGGAGDILAVRFVRENGMVHGGRACDWTRAILVEVKSTAAGPYEHFGPADRQAMLAAAGRCGAEAWLAWWPARKPLTWIPEHAWPGSASDAPRGGDPRRHPPTSDAPTGDASHPIQPESERTEYP